MKEVSIMKTVKVAILGLGTVGSGVYKLIQKRADVMEKTIGAQMEVKKSSKINLLMQSAFIVPLFGFKILSTLPFISAFTVEYSKL